LSYRVLCRSVALLAVRYDAPRFADGAISSKFDRQGSNSTGEACIIAIGCVYVYSSVHLSTVHCQIPLCNMVLTDRQRADLHSGIHEYLLSRPGDHFAAAAAALAEADPGACQPKADSKPATTPLLEKKWTAVPRLQKKVLELERAAAQSAKIHAHRAGAGAGGIGSGSASGSRRMIPRPPAVHTLKGHQGQVTCVAVHPVYTVAVSGSEDGTVKVGALRC